MSVLEKLPKPFLALAPMDDVTDSVFRQIIAELAPPDLYFTEFVNVDGLQSPGRQKLLPKLRFTQKENPIIAQLWGINPENFYRTVKEIANGSLAEEARSLQADAVQGSGEARRDTYDTVRGVSTGADDTAMRRKLSGAGSSAERQASAVQNFAGVDLNMGCPVKKVIKHGACAALIKNRELAGEIIDATKEAAGDSLPVSIKTRVGFTTVDMSWIEFLLSKKLDLLSIHGRTAKQLSSVPADWDLIGQARKMRDVLCPSTKIVGNGDVENRAQAEELAKKYQLDGVMIGRGIFHNPLAFSKAGSWEEWGQAQKLELFIKHIELFANTWQQGEYRFEALKKFAKVYISGFEGAAELRGEFMTARTPEEAIGILSIND